VFPALPEAGIPNASTDTVPAWDSLAAITLVQVLQEEFQVEIDLDKLGELVSFQAIAEYLTTESK
jgi:acyl carrier protein